jgi:hypothetical protein
MKLLITVPDVPYFIWQMLVQINNLRRMGYEEDTYYLISINNRRPSKFLLNIITNENVKCKFHLVDDTRTDTRYPASTKPFLVKDFLNDNPDMKNESFFYTDPDVIFKEKIDMSKFEGDDIWYVSDTSSYLNSAYIKSKGEQLFFDMCNIAGIDPKLVEDNDVNCGGAQWIIKNNEIDMWDEILRVCTQLHVFMNATAKKYHPPDQEYPIQSWTAEMWATIWIPWKYGIQTRISSELDFCMAYDDKARLDQVKILHNSGGVDPTNEHFCKVDHQLSPFNKDLKVSENSASYFYYQEIKDTEKNFPDLLF